MNFNSETQATRLRYLPSTSNSDNPDSEGVGTLSNSPSSHATLINFQTYTPMSNSSAMAKTTEIEPLLTSPSHETQYNLSKLNETATSSRHQATTANEITIMSSRSNNRDDDSVNSEDVTLLMPDKPVIIKTRVQNVLLLNFFALLFVGFNMTMNLAVIAIIHERVPMNEPHLPDILFDLLPDHRRFLDITEYFIMFQMACLFVLVFFHRYR